jgi:predicted lipid-binding transport protein (Tim44 family)
VQMPMKSWVETPEGRKYPNGQDGPQIQLAEYWTIAWHPEQRWFLLSIEQDQEGEHHLTETLVVTPDQDPELAADARTELAADDAAGDGGAVASLVATSFSGNARAAALDLSLVDDRFSPDVLTIAVDRAIAAWAAAIDGADGGLERLAAPEAVQTLLYGADQSETTRTVVRGPRVISVAIESVAGGEGRAATMDVALRFRARWYREDRDTVALIEGSRDQETEREQRWRFALTDDRKNPWKLASASI